MEYFYTSAASLAVAVLAFILQSKIKQINQLKKEKEELENQRNEAFNTGLLALLRVALIDAHEKYMTKGYITTHGFENWGLMYSAYKGLGGNGMIEGMNAEIEELKIKTGGQLHDQENKLSK